MLNNSQGGLDPSNARPFASQFGSGTGQSQGNFSLGGMLVLRSAGTTLPTHHQQQLILLALQPTCRVFTTYRVATTCRTHCHKTGRFQLRPAFRIDCHCHLPSLSSFLLLKTLSAVGISFRLCNMYRLGGLPTGGQQIPQGVFRGAGNPTGGLGPQGVGALSHSMQCSSE